MVTQWLLPTVVRARSVMAPHMGPGSGKHRAHRLSSQPPVIIPPQKCASGEGLGVVELKGGDAFPYERQGTRLVGGTGKGDREGLAYYGLR